MLDHKWLEQHLPHKSKMCLLDHVVSWDDDQIYCKATSHTNPNNPLSRNGKLCSSIAIEYAAQAMAAHGALLSKGDQPPRQGFIASVRNVIFYTNTLHNLNSAIDVYAKRLMGDNDNVIYEFAVAHHGEPKVSGRATVILDRNKAIKL